MLHLAPWIGTIGGIETLLAHHAATDAATGLAGRQLALFDKTDSATARTLGFSGFTLPRTMRRRLAAAAAGSAGSVVVHHGAWSVPWFADVDASSRRLVFLHDSFPRYEQMLPGLLPLVDGVLCSSGSTAAAVRRVWSGAEPERVAAPPQPIFPPATPPPARPRRDEWVIGHLGRLVRPHKAAHRLVPFVQAARRLGVKCRFEVMGDGPLRAELERPFRGDAAVRFLGWRDKEAYWRQLDTWDFAVSFSDHEGGPLTMLEAMSRGVIPLYPDIGGSLGDDYAPQVDPRCHYPRGDPEAAARALAELTAEPADALEVRRQRAIDAVRSHAQADYTAVFAETVWRVVALPRRSRPPGAHRPARLADYVPLGLLTRFWPGALER